MGYQAEPKVAGVYASFYGCKPEELICSFDGFSFYIPHEEIGIGYDKGNSWLHTDQSYLRNDFETVQSWVTSEKVSEGDATLRVLVGSHLLHGDFQKEIKSKDKADWYKLSPEQVEWYTSRGCEDIRIACDAGSMVLWDSRTIHSGAQPYKDRPNPVFRRISYVCYAPRSHASSAVLKKRIKAFEEKRTMTHHPIKGRLFGKTPRTYGKELPDIAEVDTPVLTELGRSLVGY